MRICFSRPQGVSQTNNPPAGKIRHTFKESLSHQNSCPEKPQIPCLHVRWQQQPWLYCISVKAFFFFFFLCLMLVFQINQLDPPVKRSQHWCQCTTEKQRQFWVLSGDTAVLRLFLLLISITGFSWLAEKPGSLNQHFFFFSFLLSNALGPLFFAKMATKEAKILWLDSCYNRSQLELTWNEL